MPARHRPPKLFSRFSRSFPRLGFGAMGLSGIFGSYDDRYLIDSVLFALKKGIGFIDTARAYGRSEELLGKALKEWGGPRPFLATKALPVTPQNKPPPGVWGWHHPVEADVAYPPGQIARSLETSLQELGVDHVDLLQLHNYWGHWGCDGHWLDELQSLKEQGKARHIGVSLPDHRADLGIALAASGRIDSIQVLFHIFEPLALDCLIPVCQQHGVAVIARAILDEGGLAGNLRADTEFADDDWLKGYFDCLPREIYLRKVDALRAFLPQEADTLAELAIKFALQPEGVTVALTSMHVREYAQANIGTLKKPPLSASAFDALRYQHRWIRNFYQARKYLPA